MKLSLGFSPCPNDTFIFDALVHGRIDTEGLDFEVALADVEELNQRAIRGDLHITKLSYHAYARLIPQYVLLEAGSALGNNCGPLLIAKRPFSVKEINKAKIAIPGRYTTANFLLSLAYPEARNKEETLFSEIETAVISGAADLGLIIHENRFTYAEKGLVKIRDLGEYWEETTRSPIPLGGVVIRRDLPLEVQYKVNRVLKNSVAYAFEHPKASLPYVRAHAQEMEEEVMYQHINLYVNEYSRSLGLKGKAAVQRLFEEARRKKIVPDFPENIFLENIGKKV